MKKLLLVLALLSCPAWATLINTSQLQASTNNIATPSTNFTGANLIVAFCRCGNPGCAATTITATNASLDTFTQITTASMSSADQIAMFYAQNVTGSASDVTSCHFNQGSGYGAAVALAYSGATATPLDQQGTGVNTLGGTSVTSSGTFTTTQASEISVSFATQDATTNTFTPQTGYAAEVTDAGGAYMAQDQTFSGIQAGINFSMSSNNSHHWEIVGATFKLTGGAAAPTGFNKKQKLEKVDPS